MKIKSVEIETSHIIETEEGVFYKRNGPDSWEELFGMSWETVVFKENLEEKFQKFMKNRQEALNKMYEKVFIVTQQGYEETSILGVFATKELAEEHIDWCVNIVKSRKGYSDKSQYNILEEVVEGV